MSAEGAVAPGLFAYGSLSFAPVLEALLERAPSTSPAALAGWRAARLLDRPFPGLVRAEGKVHGRLLTDLDATERRLMADYE